MYGAGRSEILGGRAGLEPGHALKPGIVPAIQAKQKPRPQNAAINGLVGRRTFQNVGEIQAEVASLSMSRRLVIGQVASVRL